MRERMNQIAKGNICKELPVFTVSPDSISRKIEAGKSITCDLMIRTKGEISVKGLVLSSDPHIVINSNGFSGYVCRICVDIKAGLGEAGKKIKGYLTIITEIGEMELPYDIEIISSSGVQETLPETIGEFCEMAREDWKRAAELFASPEFIRCPFFQNMELLCQYQGLIKGKSPMYAMEEFLTALGLKDPAVIEVENITEERNGKVKKILFSLKQKEWGYAEIALNTKADGKENESFLNYHGKWNTFELIDLFPWGKTEGIIEIPIQEHKIHGGLNEAIIEVTDGNRLMIHKIQIKTGKGCSEAHQKEQKDKKEMLQGITATFVQKYARKRNNSERSQNIAAVRLAELSAKMWEKYPQNWSLPLIQAVAWMEAEERERALSILAQVEGSIFSRRYEEPQCYSLYLYLETALKGDDVDENACQTLRDMYKKKRDVFIFYYLTEIDRQWRIKPNLVLEELERFFQEGIHNAFLYGKACRILQENPDLIHIKSAFQRQALYFGVNYDLLSVETMVQIASQVLEQEQPHWFLYHLLSHMYGRTQNKTVLQALVYVLLRHEKKDRKYFSWYELGMKENFNEQGLPQYYLLTAPVASYEPFLRQVLLYYSYEDNLEPMLQEKLYTNVYQFYQSDKRIFSLYSARIEKMMAERMMQKKINHNLAYLYRCMLHPDMVDWKMAGELPELLHMKQVMGLSPCAQSLILRYPELDMEIKVPCFSGRQEREKMANIPVHSKNVFFFQEDEEGRRKILSDLQLRQWLHRDDLEEVCKQLNQKQFGLQVNFLQHFSKNGLEQEEDANALLSMAEALPISAPFVDRVVREMVDFCKLHPEYEEGDGILLGLDICTLNKKRQRDVIDLLITKGFLGKAKENIQKIGWEELPIQSKQAYFNLWHVSAATPVADHKMLALCKNIIEENEELAQLNAALPESALCKQLEYLCAFYAGSQEEMIAILQSSIAIGCDVSHMPERLLVQSIFTGKWERLNQLFQWYMQYEEAKTLPVRATYVILCYQYFVLQQKEIAPWIRQLELEKIFEKKPPMVCILARLAFMSEQETWEDEWTKEAQGLLYGLLEKEQYFAFYHGLARYLSMPVWLEGRIILEYRGEEQKKPVLEYERSGWDIEKISVRMEEAYPGIYTQEILLFADETLTYRIYEEENGRQKELCPLCQCQEQPFETEYSHMATLNQIARYLDKEDCLMAQQAIGQMEEEAWLVEALFPIKREE